MPETKSEPKSEKVCENCQHWEELLWNGVKEYKKGFAPDGICHNPRLIKVDAHKELRTICYNDDVQIYSEFFSPRKEVYVGRKFGCVHFIEKKRG